jgi:hypothetical protein
MKNQISEEQLAEEAKLLSDSRNALSQLIIHLKGGLPNPEKRQAIVKLIEGDHWLREGVEILESFRARLQAEKEPKNVTPITPEEQTKAADAPTPEAPMGVSTETNGAD